MRRLVRLLERFAMAGSLLLAGCRPADSVVPASIAVIRIENAPASLRAGESIELRAVALAANGQPLPLIGLNWQSSDIAVATISGSGQVSALAPGSTTITASSGVISARITLAVQPPAVSAVSITPATVSMLVGQTTPVVATVTDARALPLSDRAVTWASSAPSVATVSATGAITGVSPGTATVSATSEGRVGNTVVTVLAPVATIALSAAPTNLIVGQTVQPVAIVRDAAGTQLSGRTVSWSSSSPAVATVSASGVVTAISAGSTVITASVEGKSAALTLSVMTINSRGSVLSLGPNGACAIGANLRPYCWGGYDFSGDGSSTSSMVPRPITTSESFGIVTLNAYTACGLTTAGVGYCWGQGWFGALGNGSTSYQSRPVLISGGDRTTQLSASCLLDVNGMLHCFGANAHGQIGDGTITDRLVPTPVAGSRRFRDVSSSGGHVCALATDSTAFCWGLGTNGQLGTGRLSSETVPTPVSTSEKFVQVAAGWHHTCGLRADGVVFCWGSDRAGQLGNGALPESSVPVRVETMERFLSIASGPDRSCGITAAGAAFCWGDNSLGGLGVGNTTNAAVPVRVVGTLTFSTIALGGGAEGVQFGCGITTSGALYCWGSNPFGNLGDGTLTNRLVPTLASTSVSFLAAPPR